MCRFTQHVQQYWALTVALILLLLITLLRLLLSEYDYEIDIIPIEFFDTNDTVQFETCFNYDLCNDITPKVYFINKYENADLVSRNSDVYEPTDDLVNSCFVVIFVHNKHTLSEVLYSNQTLMGLILGFNLNLLLIDTNEKFNTTSIGANNNAILKCSLYASFTNTAVSDGRSIDFSVLSLKNILGFNDFYEKFILDKNILFLTKKRQYLLTYHQTTNYRSALKLENQNFLIDQNCADYSIDYDGNFNLCFTSLKRTELLLNSTFTLLINENRFEVKYWSIELTIRLIEALQASTIPVVFDMDLEFPLKDYIRWDEIVVFLPYDHFYLLEKFTHAEIIERRRKAFNVYKAYFSSESVQFRTLLTVLKERFNLRLNGYDTVDGIQILHETNQQLDTGLNIPNYTATRLKARTKHATLLNTYFRWNKLYNPFKYFHQTPFDPFVPTDVRYRIKLREYDNLYTTHSHNSTYLHGGQSGYRTHLGGNYDEDEGYTMVIYTFKREKMLEYHLDLYLEARYLKRILVVWDSYDVKPSIRFMIKYHRYFETKFICLISNQPDTLNNRFLPYTLIETEAVVNLDDDSTVPLVDLELGFRVWRENREKLVGYSQRIHTWDVKTSSFIYSTNHYCEYSIMLTRVAFYHSFYNYMYTYMVDGRIRRLIDEYINCEDLAFSYMIADLTRKPPLKSGIATHDQCKTCALFSDEKDSISLKGDHKQKRNNCLQFFNAIYGYNPLLYTQYRADEGYCTSDLIDFEKEEEFLVNYAWKLKE